MGSVPPTPVPAPHPQIKYIKVLNNIFSTVPLLQEEVILDAAMLSSGASADMVAAAVAAAIQEGSLGAVRWNPAARWVECRRAMGT